MHEWIWNKHTNMLMPWHKMYSRTHVLAHTDGHTHRMVWRFTIVSFYFSVKVLSFPTIWFLFACFFTFEPLHWSSCVIFSPWFSIQNCTNLTPPPPLPLFFGLKCKWKPSGERDRQESLIFCDKQAWRYKLLVLNWNRCKLSIRFNNLTRVVVMPFF